MVDLFRNACWIFETSWTIAISSYSHSTILLPFLAPAWYSKKEGITHSWAKKAEGNKGTLYITLQQNHSTQLWTSVHIVFMSKEGAKIEEKNKSQYATFPTEPNKLYHIAPKKGQKAVRVSIVHPLGAFGSTRTICAILLYFDCKKGWKFSSLKNIFKRMEAFH